MQSHEVICRLILLAQATFVASQALYIGLAYIGRRNFRHIVAMGISYTLMTGFLCAVLWGGDNKFNFGAFCIGFVTFVIGNAGLWMIREKARETKNGDKGK